VSRARNVDGHPIQSARILGVRVEDVTLSEAVHITTGFVEQGGPHLVATVNTEFVVDAQRDAAFRDILNEAELCVPDGHGLIWASPLTGLRLREHVAGTDLVESLMSVCASRGFRAFFLGAAPGVADEAAAQFVRRYPSLQIAGTFGGTPRESDDESARAAIAAAGHVDVLLVAYGAPAQEKWLARNLPLLQVSVGIGVGGVFDYVSGRVRRAPRWVRSLGLEWLFRLAMQPQRWRRQLALPLFVLLVLKAAATGTLGVPR
jgi:N-acetylglucosaminyldiphosphoundecaprenol N-acetyl-beta-D-mannosaminyltransferase